MLFFVFFVLGFCFQNYVLHVGLHLVHVHGVVDLLDKGVPVNRVHSVEELTIRPQSMGDLILLHPLLWAITTILGRRWDTRVLIKVNTLAQDLILDHLFHHLGNADPCNLALGFDHIVRNTNMVLLAELVELDKILVVGVLVQILERALLTSGGNLDNIANREVNKHGVQDTAIHIVNTQR